MKYILSIFCISFFCIQNFVAAKAVELRTIEEYLDSIDNASISNEFIGYNLSYNPQIISFYDNRENSIEFYKQLDISFRKANYEEYDAIIILASTFNSNFKSKYFSFVPETKPIDIINENGEPDSIFCLSSSKGIGLKLVYNSKKLKFFFQEGDFTFTSKDESIYKTIHYKAFEKITKQKKFKIFSVWKFANKLNYYPNDANLPMHIVKDESNKMYGFQDVYYRWAIPSEFEYALNFDGDYAIVVKNGRSGMIRKDKSYQIELKYKHILKISEKDIYIVIALDGNMGLINSKDEIIIPFEYTKIVMEPYPEKQYLIVTKNSKSGLFNYNTLVMDYPVKYDAIEIKKFSQYEIGIFCTNKKTIYWYDYTNHSLIDSTYTNVVSEPREYLIVQKNNKWGIVNFNNNIMVPFVYDDLYRIPASNNIHVQIDSSCGVITTSNKIIVDVKYDVVEEFYKNKGTSFYLVTKNKSKGLLNSNNEVIIPVQFKSIIIGNVNCLGVKSAERLVYNYEGQLLDTITSYSGGSHNRTIIFQNHNKYGLINTDTYKIILPAVYEKINFNSLENYYEVSDGLRLFYYSEDGYQIK